MRVAAGLSLGDLVFGCLQLGGGGGFLGFLLVFQGLLDALAASRFAFSLGPLVLVVVAGVKILFTCVCLSIR